MKPSGPVLKSNNYCHYLNWCISSLLEHYFVVNDIVFFHFQVWVRKGDGSKTKLYIGQLQKGKYKIKKS